MFWRTSLLAPKKGAGGERLNFAICTRLLLDVIRRANGRRRHPLCRELRPAPPRENGLSPTASGLTRSREVRGEPAEQHSKRGTADHADCRGSVDRSALFPESVVHKSGERGNHRVLVVEKRTFRGNVPAGLRNAGWFSAPVPRVVRKLAAAGTST